MSTTYTARYVFPVAGLPLERGTITVAGDTIESVNVHGERTADIDLGNAAIIPGLVNAHTHLDLSGARGKIPPTDPNHFCDWLLGIIEYRKTRTVEEILSDIEQGFQESIRFGTTIIGDISVDGMSYDTLVDSQCRSLLFWEIIGLSQDRSEECVERFLHFVSFHPPVFNTLHYATSPHAPYSCHHEMAMEQIACYGGAIHLAESPGEKELLADRCGPFQQFLQRLGVWEPEAYRYQAEEFVTEQWDEYRRPLRSYVHCNYLSPEVPFEESQSVIYCPRTHAAFRHPPHPFREFLARGVNVALGTDSLASNPDLDLLAEARFVKQRHPDVSGETLLRMATLNGAKALGWSDECGTLEPGKSADFVVLPLADVEAEDPHELFVGESSIDGPRRTMFRGEWRE